MGGITSIESEVNKELHLALITAKTVEMLDEAARGSLQH
jgi:hypothetical protein